MKAKDWVISIAKLVAEDAVPVPAGVELAGFQQHAATRLVAMIERWGGALLADAVGLGKTRVALVVAAALARNQRIHGVRGPIAFVVPSRLRSQWHEAITAAGCEDVVVVSHTALSRGWEPKQTPSVVIVDEAHRFRNQTARRTNLERWTRVPTLLVTATPVANSLDDLWNLLALFLDDADVRRTIGWDLSTARRLAETGEWDPLELLREVTIRRLEPPESTGFGSRPTTKLEVVRYDPDADEAWLWANLESELRQLSLFRDHDDWPQGLFVEHVLRRWESGPDALLETCVELVAYAERALDAARDGRPFDRNSFRELFGEQPNQEVFPFLLERASGPVQCAFAIADDAVRIARLRDIVASVCGTASGRERVVLDLVQDGTQLLVFTSYRSAATGLFHRLTSALGPSARVGVVTGSRAWSTGLGRVPPADLLRRFSPRSHGIELKDHEMLQVLIATDCINEGVNLQDCGRVVLADLPYTPLGIEQRVGRLLRPGGPHTEVEVILPRPRNWNDSLGMRRRLSAKVDAARRGGFTGATGPFAIWTALERIARLRGGEQLPEACRTTEAPNAWLTLARVDQRLCLLPIGDMPSLATTLNDLAWSEAEVTPCRVPDVVARMLDARLSFLRAARSAPSPLALDSPEAKAWNRLVEDESNVEELRARLLRQQPRPIRRQLESLANHGASSRLRRFVESLETLPEPRVELITTIGLSVPSHKP